MSRTSVPDTETATAPAVAPSPSAPRHRRPSRILRTVTGIGAALVTAGIILLLFTAYQVWGTSWTQEHTQASLRHQLQSELKPSLAPTHVHTVLPALRSPARTASSTAAPAQGQPVGVLQIPAIGVDQVIVEGTATPDLSKGPGHYVGTPLPGQAGNAAIAGHRTTWGHPFYNLDAVKPGDRILVTTLQGRFLYRAGTPQVVLPSDGAVLQPTASPTITLTTCNPRFSAAQRLVVQGRLVASALGGGRTYRSGARGQAGATTQLAGTSNGNWVTVVLWGLLVVAAALAIWLVARLLRRRWPLYLAGVPVLLVLLYFLFQSVTPLLPPSF